MILLNSITQYGIVLIGNLMSGDDKRCKCIMVRKYFNFINGNLVRLAIVYMIQNYRENAYKVSMFVNLYLFRYDQF